VKIPEWLFDKKCTTQMDLGDFSAGFIYTWSGVCIAFAFSCLHPSVRSGWRHYVFLFCVDRYMFMCRWRYSPAALPLTFSYVYNFVLAFILVV